MLEYVRCNLCGADRYSVVYKTYTGDISALEEGYKITDHSVNAPLRIVKCRFCGLVYANPRPAPSRLASIYKCMKDDLYVEEEEGRRLSSAPTLRVLKRMHKPGKLLEVGCATGFFLDEARKAGWEVFGLELSAWAAGYARDKLGLSNILECALEDAKYPENYFDAVIMKDVIEHLPDPKNMLSRLRKVLKSDGVICVNTPDIDSFVSRMLKARWWGVKQQHLTYFTKKTLFKMLNAAGFTPVRAKSHTRVFSLKYWSSRLESHSKFLRDVFAFLISRGVLKNVLLPVDLKDQLEVYSRKTRSIKYLDELEKPAHFEKKANLKVIAVLPAYNAARTLERTVRDIPRDAVDDIILVDDKSSDGTAKEAKRLGLKTFVHEENKGYGANQKTCYVKALEAGADIVVMVHPDYQYDPKAIIELVEPIKEGRADAVFGSRMMKGGALEGGMPPWKHNVNILLTALENVSFGTYLTEYHSGFRAYSAKALRSVNFQLNSDGFVFDTEIIAQILMHDFKIEEVPIRTRYFDEASSIRLLPSIIYGLGILWTIMKYALHAKGVFRFKQLE